MAGKTKTMTQVRKILQCIEKGWSIRKIDRDTGISRNIEELLKLDDGELSRLLLKPIIEDDRRYTILCKQLPRMERDLAKVGVTRKRLWEAYLQEHPDGYGYSQFCDYLQQWRKAGQIVMHHDHKPGELLEVDFAGKKLSYVDEHMGELIDSESLVTVLPFSQMIYLEVLENQQQEHLISGLGHAMEYYEGVPQAVKVDNMLSAVTKADRYEPTFTDLMDEFATHYGTTAITARVRKPRDKASFEASVRIVYQEIYAELGNQMFFSIEQINIDPDP